MKECPKCGTVYTDISLSYCFADGTPLVAEVGGEKTEVLPNFADETETVTPLANETKRTNLPTVETVVRNKENQNKGVSPFWILATFGLFGTLLIGVFSIWLFSEQIFSNDNVAQENNSNSVSNVNKDESPTPKTAEPVEETSTPPKETKPTEKPTIKPTPEKTKTPKSNLYRVVGVKSNDVLYIRPKAGNLKVVVGKIPPNAKGIRIMGGRKKVGKGSWVLISYNGKKGWVNSRFLAKEK